MFRTATKPLRVRPQKVQQASLCPCTVGLQYDVVTLLKGKQSALNILEIDIPCLDEVHGQPGPTHNQLKTTADTFFLPLYGEKSSMTMNDAHARFYRSRKKPPLLKKLPPTDSNKQLHVFRAHLQMLLWKAADQHDPPEEDRDITNFGWHIEGSTITPAVSTVPVAPQVLLDVVNCSCIAEGYAAAAYAAVVTAKTTKRN